MPLPLGLEIEGIQMATASNKGTYETTNMAVRATYFNVALKSHEDLLYMFDQTSYPEILGHR